MRAKYKGNCKYQDITECQGIRKGQDIIHLGKDNTFHYQCDIDYLTLPKYKKYRIEFNESQDRQNWDSMQNETYYTNIETQLGA